MNDARKKWLQLSLFNLLLVACIGVVLRYKIAFPLPFIDQKFLLHGHSHFAFAGWVTQALMSLLVGHLAKGGLNNAFIKYRWILWANLIAAYGMLVTFPIEGYAPLSIFFSTLSIIVSYAFAVIYWKDLNRTQNQGVSRIWFQAAIFFNAISSLGPFSLAYMLASKHFNQSFYLGSVYFFLHFQYNGWFFFACMGLLANRLSQNGVSDKKLQFIFNLFFIPCIPAYLLSVLWLPLPLWVYLLAVLAVLLQLTGWVYLVNCTRAVIGNVKLCTDKFTQYIFVLCALAFSIKLVLQSLSAIPSLSQLAFGFRPIVIGYLHLVLLGVITLFILGYCTGQRLIPVNKTVLTGLVIFITGIICNEALLMVQGIGNMNYMAVPSINLLLLGAALLLFSGMVILNYGVLA